MALARWVLTANVTIPAGSVAAPTAGEQEFGSSNWAGPGTGATATWGGMEPYTFLQGTVIYADGGTPANPATGPQQLYQAIIAVNATGLRAFVDGQDNVGHAALAN
jgi:hypothetical protein